MTTKVQTLQNKKEWRVPRVNRGGYQGILFGGEVFLYRLTNHITTIDEFTNNLQSIFEVFIWNINSDNKNSRCHTPHAQLSMPLIINKTI